MLTSASNVSQVNGLHVTKQDLSRPLLPEGSKESSHGEADLEDWLELEQ